MVRLDLCDQRSQSVALPRFWNWVSWERDRWFPCTESIHSQTRAPDESHLECGGGIMLGILHGASCAMSTYSWIRTLDWPWRFPLPKAIVRCSQGFAIHWIYRKKQLNYSPTLLVTEQNQRSRDHQQLNATEQLDVQWNPLRNTHLGKPWFVIVIEPVQIDRVEAVKLRVSKWSDDWSAINYSDT